MSNCELCGKEDELIKIKVEGSIIKVCNNCSGFGAKLEEISERKIEKRKVKEEKIETIIENFNKILKKEREKRGLTQEELAKKIKEKTSVIHKLESGHMEPSLELIQKLERFFGIKLKKDEELEKVSLKKEEVRGMTLGDLLGNSVPKK